MTKMAVADGVREAEEIARNNDGRLPRAKVIREINPNLLYAIYNHPQAFAHIPRGFQRNKRGSVERSVELARQLAAANGGKLPCHVDLAKDYPGLVHAMYRAPEAFAGIPRAERSRRRAVVLDAFVRQAEELARANGGSLEVTRKLQAQHNALVLAIRRNPEAFAHIPRIRRDMRSIEEHVRGAERIAAGNGGRLPAPATMKKEHSRLELAMRRQPEAFAHIPRESKIVRISEYRQLAEKLAAENKGNIPSVSSLIRMSHRNLEWAIYRRPDAFAGMRQELQDSACRLVGLRTFLADGSMIDIKVSSDSTND